MQATLSCKTNTRSNTQMSADDNQPFVDMDTIRRRVATIKNRWSPETAAARAVEVRRRRESLEDLVLDLLTDISDSEESCDIREHGFNLVG